MSKYLPQALGATGLVVAGPVVAVWALRAWQIIGSTTLAVAIGVILSLAVSFGGSTYWANRDSSRDVLFSELMIWGWLRRWRAEHKLTAALEHLAELTATDVAREGTPQLAMLTELAEALEAGDPYTRNHSRRVARYASMIADRLGLAADEVDRIRTAAMVHDVGKVRTPIEVLHKPGKLTDEEYTIIKAHPVDGAQLVEALGDDRLTAIVRHHHERLDGRGYPDGLKGEEIPLGARIVAVADTFDAITSARAYRPASPHRKALDILIKEAGTQLDADAVRAFRGCYSGRRPFALWMTVLAFPQRISTTLGNGTTASAASLPKMVMAASTVAVVGGAAASAHPLMVVPVAPQATAAATVAATAASHASASPAPAQGTPSVAPALGAKLTSPSVRTREHSMLRRPAAVSHRFPSSPLGAHRVARSSSPTSTLPVNPAPSSPPVSTPAPSAAPASSTASSAPVSTVAAVPTATPTSIPTSTPSTKGSGSGGGSSHSSTKDHGQGSGGAGQGKGHGHGGDPTKPKTTPTPTTTPGKGNGNGTGTVNGTGNGNGKGAVNGKGDGNADGNGNGKAGGDGKGGGNAATAGGNGHGNGNGGATSSAGCNGNGSSDSGNGKGKASDADGNGGTFSLSGNGNGSANGTGNADGNGTAAGVGNGAGDGNGNGNGNGATGTTTTGNGNGTATGTGNAGGNSNGTAGTTGNGHSHTAR